MQDAERVHEQMDEMVLRAQMRASVTLDHKKIALDRKELAERELTKFRCMHEVFTMSEQVLRQRQQQLTQAPEPPTQPILNGLEDAIQNLQALQRQAQDAVARGEGAFHALSAMEETLGKEAVEATARARGIEARYEKTIGVAETRTSEENEISEEVEAPEEPETAEEPDPPEGPEEPQEPPQSKGVPGFLERLEQAQEDEENEDAEDSAKEPIGAP